MSFGIELATYGFIFAIFAIMGLKVYADTKAKPTKKKEVKKSGMKKKTKYVVIEGVAYPLADKQKRAKPEPQGTKLISLSDIQV